MIGNVRICYSRYGWLLVYNYSHEPASVMLFNPFTNDIRELPPIGYTRSKCFSEPPTSPDCMIVGFEPENEYGFYLHFKNQNVVKIGFLVDFGEILPLSICSDGRDVYALEARGRLDVYRIVEGERNFWEVVAEAPRGCAFAAQCFLVKCEEHHLLLVRVDECGELVEVFKLNDHKSTQEWEKIDSLGRRMIYICGSTCLCMEAQTSEMENKIYFPRLHSNNGKIVFYFLETCKYHTFNGRKVEEESFGDFLGTKYILNPHAWIEPSWYVD